MASPNKLQGSLSKYEAPKPSKSEKKKGGGVADVIGAVGGIVSAFSYKSPAKNMKTGEYNHSFEKGYTPYKMTGHELPGIKQRSGSVAKLKAFDSPTGLNAGMVDGISTSPNKFGGGMMSAMSGMGGIMDRLKKDRQKPQGGGGNAVIGTGGGGGGVAPHGPEAHTGGGGGKGGKMWGGIGNAVTGGDGGAEEALDPQSAKKQEIVNSLKEKGLRGLGMKGGKFGRMG